ncbi:hypothetical protein C1645_745464 [Glomus cerebriforme]|uniref:CRESS-DNA virus Rep endonuclease domain-containing protein n=1 Tax=Glomus cerebriforme TaxID=658196 RepID=A0A397S7Z8_9GLOM|nr:hypothetical protein C1645_745464 [Glomus cerebriforme]
MPADRQSRFRLQSKKLFLTYPRCSLGKNDALTILRRLCLTHVVESYVVASEQHEDGTPYLHCYLALSGKIDKRSPACFDLDFGGEKFHRNYQGARDAGDVIAYCKKGGDFIQLGTDVAVRRTVKEIMAESVTREEFFASMERDHGKFLLQSFGNISSFADFKFQPVPKLYDNPFGQGSFVVPQVLLDWVQANVINKPFRPLSLVLMGATRTGKSSWARSLGCHIYMQKRINWDLWDDEASFVILDDIPVEELKRFNNWKVLMGAQKSFRLDRRMGG